MSRQEYKAATENESEYQDISSSQVPTEEDDAFLLIRKDELNEMNIVRALIEFGTKAWDESHTVADHLFEEFETNGLNELFDNKNLLKIIDTFKIWYDAGLDPGPKNFLYHEDVSMSSLTISLMESPYELSVNWKDHYDGPMPGREELYREEVSSTMNYLKLRKIKRLIDENQRDMERIHTTDEQTTLIQTHQHLKQLEIEITRQMGTVIFK